jgi:hypothetical protein
MNASGTKLKKSAKKKPSVSKKKRSVRHFRKSAPSGGLAACVMRTRSPRRAVKRGDVVLERFEKGESIADFIDFSAGKFVQIA